MCVNKYSVVEIGDGRLNYCCNMSEKHTPSGQRKKKEKWRETVEREKKDGKISKLKKEIFLVDV